MYFNILHIFCCLWQPEPIHMLIPLEIPGASSTISNLKRAIAEYVAEYNVCKCRPCQNGGTLALLDGKCICLCLQLFEGAACQTYKRDRIRVQGKPKQLFSQCNPTSTKVGMLSKC